MMRSFRPSTYAIELNAVSDEILFLFFAKRILEFKVSSILFEIDKLSKPATSYIFSGVSWSIKYQVEIIDLNLRPLSNTPRSDNNCIT